MIFLKKTKKLFIALFTTFLFVFLVAGCGMTINEQIPPTTHGQVEDVPQEKESPEMETHEPEHSLENNENSLRDQTIRYETVEIRYPENEDGIPYIHDMLINETDKIITGIERAMVAFDKNGNPVRVHWNALSSGAGSAYMFVYEDKELKINPDQITDIDGGWSLFDWNEEEKAANDSIEYVLYYFKSITFDGDETWENPSFEDWTKEFEGQQVENDVLENYYPYEEVIA